MRCRCGYRPVRAGCSPPSLLFIILFGLCVTLNSALEHSVEDKAARDPALVTREFDIGYGPETFDFYVPPDVSQCYREEAGSKVARKPKFNGMSGKFINM